MDLPEDQSPHDSRSPRGIEPTLAERREQFATQLFAAVRKRKPAKVRDLARLAGEQRWEVAVRPLCDLLMPPSPRWRTPGHGKHGWSEARTAAVTALHQIGDVTSCQALVYAAVSDDDFVVRAAAAVALEAIGAAAVPYIVAAIRGSADWHLDGMRALLTSLGNENIHSDSERRVVGMALIDVLYENFPGLPARWTRPARRMGRTVAAVTTVAMLIAALRGGAELGGLFGAIIVGSISGLIVRAVASIFFRAAGSSIERSQLFDAAAQSIIRLNDRRAVPALLALAFDSPGMAIKSSSRHARMCLHALLPLISEQDGTHFSSQDIEMLNTGLGRTLDPGLLVALLHAAGCVGNATCRRRINRLAKHRRSSEVREAAVLALDGINARETRLEQAKSLVRGSNAPETRPDLLLRAAMPEPDQQPNQLLRATGSDTSPLPD